MDNREAQLDRETAELIAAQKQGGFAKLRTYTRLAGPGWLQSALILGGGSLAGSLYLGVLTGVSAIWIQPIAIILTIIMFGAFSYVITSTGKRPFEAINKHINPVLGWSWALASLASCMVWAMPQYALATGVIQQNLAPAVLGPDGTLGNLTSRILITGSIFILVTSVAWHYSKTGTAVKTFEWVLKAMIYLIVACFIGVVVRLAFLPGGLDWSAIFRGMIPDPSLFFRPSDGFDPLLQAVPAEFREYWSDVIVKRQREVMIAVTAAASGVNATFLLAYSILRRGWGKEYRELAIFDLGTGMFIPFAIATTCIIIAGSHQFYTVQQPGFVTTEETGVPAYEPSAAHIREYEGLMRGRILYEDPAADDTILFGTGFETRIGEISAAEKQMAATLLTRDAFDLASSLEPLTGGFFARIIFGLGVLGMTISSVILQMLVSGMVICEMLGHSHTGRTLRYGSLAAATGILGPFIWQKAAFWLAIPTSIFAFILLPGAYFTFYLMMNKRELMGKEMPAGNRLILLNVVMMLVIIIFSGVSAYVIWINAGIWGAAAILVFLLAIIAGHFHVKNKMPDQREMDL
jgi:Mn2+/Fe2+ NRAMP family transporter